MSEYSTIEQAWSNRIERFVKDNYKVDCTTTRNGAGYGFTITFENKTHCLMCADFSYLFNWLWDEFRLHVTAIQLDEDGWGRAIILLQIMEGNADLIVWRQNEIHRDGETEGK